MRRVRSRACLTCKSPRIRSPRRSTACSHSAWCGGSARIAANATAPIRKSRHSSPANQKEHRTLVRGRGCEACHRTGYLGRIGIFELLVVSEALNRAITARESLARLRELGEREGMQLMRHDGWVKVQAEITTVEEVLRVTAH